MIKAVPKTPNGAWRESPLGMVAISVGQPYHEGENLKALLEFAQSNFAHVSILLADTLQRFNLRAEQGFTEIEAHAATLKAGDSYLARHASAINELKVIRWDEHETNNHFLEVHKTLKDLVTTEPTYMAALDADVSKYLERRRRRGFHISPEMVTLGRAYITREAAGDLAAAKVGGMRAVIYPSPRLHLYAAIDRSQLSFAAPMRDNFRWCHVKLKADSPKGK